MWFQLITVRRLDNSPPNVPTSESLEPVNVFLHGWKDFEDVIKWNILRWEIILDYPVGNHNILTVFVRGERKAQAEEKKAVRWL